MNPVSRRLLVGLAAAFVVAVVAVVVGAWAVRESDDASAAPTEAPSHFVSRTIATLARDDYATAWKSLYPAHQAVAPRDEYVACEMKNPLAWKLRSIRVVRVVDRVIHVPGDEQDVAAKSVTLRLRVFEKAVGLEEAFSHTFTAVAVGRNWSWILTPGQYDRYNSDSCA